MASLPTRIWNRVLERAQAIVERRGLRNARPFKKGNSLDRGGLDGGDELARKFCSKPWDHFEIGSDGKAWVCCPQWLDTPIGNCQDDDLLDVWNSPMNQSIRRSILDGDYRYCNRNECPLIQSGDLPERDAVTDPRLRRIIDERAIVTDEPPQVFNLCYDESCNLRCPSCRKDMIHFTAGRQFDTRSRIQDRLVAALFAEPHERAFSVNITGSGDPFGSTLFRDLLLGLDGRDFPNVEFDLQTNGVLFTPEMWQRLARLHGNIRNVVVSFDAATAETYAYTRKGGRWSKLLDNMRFLSDLRGRDAIRGLRADYVVQQKNYTEMPAFVRLIQEIGNVDQISFSLITDWGTYSKVEFSQHAIWKRDHPEFADFLRTLRDPALEDPIVYLGNVSEYHRAASGC